MNHKIDDDYYFSQDVANRVPQFMYLHSALFLLATLIATSLLDSNIGYEKKEKEETKLLNEDQEE